MSFIKKYKTKTLHLRIQALHFLHSTTTRGHRPQENFFLSAKKGG